MKTAVPLLIIGTAVLFLLCGCATSVGTPSRKLLPCQETQPLRVAVLPPRIHPDIAPENIQPDKPLYKQLLDGRGTTVTSATASKDIGLEIVSELTEAKKYQRIFTVTDENDARSMNADAILTVTVWDYRTVNLGANKKYPLMAASSILLSQYWMKWLTLEARLEWEVKLTSAKDGSTLYRKRLKRTYTDQVRSAFGYHFTNKMLSFLQTRAVPDFIGEIFELNMVAPPAPPEKNSVSPEAKPAEPENQSTEQTMSAT